MEVREQVVAREDGSDHREQHERRNREDHALLKEAPWFTRGLAKEERHHPEGEQEHHADDDDRGEDVVPERQRQSTLPGAAGLAERPSAGRKRDKGDEQSDRDDEGGEATPAHDQSVAPRPV